eukprot:gene2701-3897_t
MSWKPQQQSLEDLVKLLKSTTEGNSQVQRDIYTKLEELNKQYFDFNNYLVYVFSNLKDIDPGIRRIAGILLKNNIKNDFNDRIKGEALEHIQGHILQCLTDTNEAVRHTAGSFISDFVSMKGLEKWANLLPSLIQILGQSQNLSTQEGVMSALLKICEDSHEDLESEKYGRPLNNLLPIFIKFLEHPDDTVRKHALSSILVFLDTPSDNFPNAIISNMDTLLPRIFQLAHDKSLSIQRRVCAAFTLLLKTPQYLDKDMKAIFEYILVSSQHKDEYVALEATEFWSHLTETEYFENYSKLFSVYLPKLIPILVENMVFTENDRITYEEESERPDRDQDINPKNLFSHAKEHTVHDDTSSSHTSSTIQGSDDEDDDDDDLQWDDSGDDWTLRKSSSLTLDNIANFYRESILDIALPVIQQKIDGKQDWFVRESGILALGAISEGCRSGMVKFLPELIPYLVTLLKDSKPLVRCITCWTIGRYTTWIVSEQGSKLFPLVLQGILEKMMDTNKKVQESACSTFIGLTELSRSEIFPFIFPCLQAISKAFSFYSKKNLLSLYDALTILCDMCGPEMKKKDYIELIMPPLIEKWNKIPNDDPKLIPLLDCLQSVAIALQDGFVTFAPTIFKRCLVLMNESLVDKNKEASDDFLVCSLDLISGMVEGLGSGVENLISGTEFLKMLYFCCQEKRTDVRQASFALLGELSKCCIGLFQTTMNDFMAILIQNLQITNTSACNNASWAIGEFLISLGTERSKPYCEAILSKEIQIINSKNLKLSLMENTAVTIGRLAYVCPDLVAPHLASFCTYWCIALKTVRHTSEKDHAFRGLCLMVRKNPQATLQSFPYICDAIASWTNPPKELGEEFYTLLHGFKKSIGDGWPTYYATFPKDLVETLSKTYGL